jgi:hypothetical protein
MKLDNDKPQAIQDIEKIEKEQTEKLSSSTEGVKTAEAKKRE